MAKTALELRQEANNLLKDAQALVTSDKDLSAEDQEQFDRMFTEHEKLLKRAESIEKAANARAHLDAPTTEDLPPEGNQRGGSQKSDQDDWATWDDEPEYRAGDIKDSRLYHDHFFDMLRGDSRATNQRMVGADAQQRDAMKVSIDSQGGYLTAPTKFLNGIYTGLDEKVHIRQLATNHRVRTAQSLGIITLIDDADDFEWTTELGEPKRDDGVTFGRRTFECHPMRKEIEFSRTLLRAVPQVETFVRGRVVKKHAVTMEYNYLFGDGVKKPLGLFTASDDGIPESQDVVAGDGSKLTADGLIDVVFSLDEEYAANGRWMFNRQTIKEIVKMRDNDGQFLWQTDMRSGQPATILGYPYIMSKHIPSTMAAGSYVGMFADFSYYWTLDALTLRVERHNLGIRQNKVGLIWEYEGDGQPQEGDAFIRVVAG